MWTASSGERGGEGRRGEERRGEEMRGDERRGEHRGLDRLTLRGIFMDLVVDRNTLESAKRLLEVCVETDSIVGGEGGGGGGGSKSGKR